MLGQLLRFGGVGALATVLHVAVAMLASELAGAAPLLANGLGFAVALLWSYLGHGRLSFRTELRHDIHGPRFFVVALAGFLVSSGITQIISVSYGGPFALAMFVVALVVPLVSFVICKIWVFAPHAGGP